MKDVMNATINEVSNIIYFILKEEIDKYDWGDYTVTIYKDPSIFVTLQYDFPVCGVTATDYQVGFFLNNLIKILNSIMILLGGRWWQKFLCKIFTFKSRERILHKIIKQLVAHEFRHAVQYEFLRSKGLDPNMVMEKENSKKYERRCHEEDAIAFSKGKANDLETVFAQYL